MLRVEDSIGKKINNFEIEACIGEGSMGIVYRAFHPQLQRYAAIKLLKPELVNRADSFERFLQEARTASRLNHPNIVNVINFGEFGDSYYLMMDYVEGPTLRKLLTEQGGLRLRDTAQIFTQIADVLSFAHEHGVLHRDLKPDNILLTESNLPEQPYTAKVTDFGLVKIAEDSLTNTLDGTTLGTPAYMSPEQCMGKPLDHRSDLYALGVMLYETLTGQRPYPIRDLFDAVRFHAGGSFVPPRAHVPDLPMQLNLLVRRLMAPEIDNRPENAAEVKAHLAEFLPDSTILDTHTSRIVDRIQSEIHLTSKLKETDLLSRMRDTTREVSKPLPYCIVVAYKGNITRVYPPLIEGEKLVVGRAKEVNIVLESPDRFVSKQHCAVTVEGGRVWVRDLNSTNGTFIGAERLPPQERTLWRDENPIVLGAFELMLQYQGPRKNDTTPLKDEIEPTMVQEIYTLVCEGGAPSRVPIMARPLLIGRLPDCDMVLSNTRISKKHCRIELQADETIVVTDLNSTNGTYLNNRRLPPHEGIIWEADNPLRVGDYIIYLE